MIKQLPERKTIINKRQSATTKIWRAVGMMLCIIGLISSSCNTSTKTEDRGVVEIIVTTINRSVKLIETSGINPLYDPISDLAWEDVDEAAIAKLNGTGYWENIPGIDYGLCTGYVSWVAKNHLGLKNYPSRSSTPLRRNGGEYVSSQRLWLKENAYLVGTATTVNGVVEYKGGRYKPGDIIVFNSKSDGSEGKFVERESFDYWGSDHYEFFTHIGVVSSDNTYWDETLDIENMMATAEMKGTLPEGMYNLFHNVESYGGVCNILSPEQFITRDVPDDDTNFSRSYEVYRVLSPS